MNPLKKYKLKTYVYTATFILGLAWIGYTLYTQQWILLILGTLFTLLTLTMCFVVYTPKLVGTQSTLTMLYLRFGKDKNQKIKLKLQKKTLSNSS